MRTNPGANINTDWQINGIVKPAHVNALTRSIKYDYVVTAQMLEGKTGDVSVEELLGGAWTTDAGEYHILINTEVNDAITLCFNGASTGEHGSIIRVHVYTLGPINAKVTGESTFKYFYFHTSGARGRVQFSGLGCNTYVGSFSLASEITLPVGAIFKYELALDSVPAGEGAEIGKEAWMSNAIMPPSQFIDLGTEVLSITGTSPWDFSSAITLPENVTEEALIDRIDAVLSAGVLPVARIIVKEDEGTPPGSSAGHDGTPCTTYAPLAGVRCCGFFFADPVLPIRGRFNYGHVEEADMTKRFFYVGYDKNLPDSPAVVRRQEWRTE